MPNKDMSTPTPETPAPEAPLTRRGRRSGGQRSGRHRALSQAAAVLARRLPHARCGGQRHLRRQGPQSQGARVELHAARRAHQPHRPHDRHDGEHGVRIRAHRGRGAAARSQPHQALPAALQRADARRQVVSLHPHRARQAGAADHEASRCAQPQGRLLRAVRVGRGGQPHHQHAGARVPAALLLRQRLRKPHAAVPAASDQALLGAVHRRDRARRVRASRRRGGALPARREPERSHHVPAADGGGILAARVRARRPLPRPAVGAGARHRRPVDQPGGHRGG